MISKFARWLVLCTVILAACPLYFPGQSLFEPVGPLTYYGAEPMASSPQYKPNQPRIVTQSTVDTQIYGSKVGPTGGAGVQWLWKF
ncbi:MAG: hypothetical protein ACP5SH_16230 [Syntrophobacteraceae bacterium]